MRRTLAAAVASAALAPAAAARPDLAVRLPPRLAMRPPAAAPTPPAGTPAPPPGAARGGPASAATDSGATSDVPLAERVVFRFNLGFAIDGGRPSGRPLTSGAALDETRDYERLRTYGLGDVALGSRGLLATSLSTYLAASFRFDQDLGQTAGAVPTARDNPSAREVLVRSGFAELAGFLPGRLRPVYLRAGRQYRYGVAVAQLDGASAGYDGAAIGASAFVGRRVSSWLPDGRDGLDLDRPTLGGFALRVDLAAVSRAPLTFHFHGLRFDGVDNLEGGVAVRLGPAVARASLRTRDGRAARQALSLFARLPWAIALNVDLDHRSGGDWMYDLIAAGRGRAADDLRRYLDLGAPLPRTTVDVRAGTVLLSNLDVVVRAGGGIDQRPDDAEPTAYSPGYLEAGGVVEVRLRRNLRFGTALTTRRYQRADPRPSADGPGPDPLPTTAAGLGERGETLFSARLHYSAEARRFNAWAEAYGRVAVVQSPWRAPTDPATERRTGSRFGVEAWVGRRLRFRGEYDLSLAELRYAPELTGVKSLRVIAEGSY